MPSIKLNKTDKRLNISSIKLNGIVKLYNKIVLMIILYILSINFVTAVLKPGHCIIQYTNTYHI